MTIVAPMDEILERSHVVALPMRVKFRGITVREAVLFDGPKGWGEFSPFVEYGVQEAAQWLRCGLEMAFQGPPPMIRDTVEVNATIPAVSPDQVPEILARYPGCTTVKVKVAEGDDAARVAMVREVLPDARIRVDANRGWTVDQAVAASKRLGELEYMEQPCASVAELAELRRRISVPIAADESIRRVSDPYEVARLHAADVAVVKAAPLGGPRNIVDIAKFYQQRGLSLTVASALDTGVGMNAGIAVAAAIDSNPAGLATQRLFVEDVTEPRTIVDGKMSAEMLSPDPARLSEFEVTGPRRDWWLERVRGALECLHDFIP